MTPHKDRPSLGVGVPLGGTLGGGPEVVGCGGTQQRHACGCTGTGAEQGTCRQRMLPTQLTAKLRHSKLALLAQPLRWSRPCSVRPLAGAAGAPPALCALSTATDPVLSLK